MARQSAYITHVSAGSGAEEAHEASGAAGLSPPTEFNSLFWFCFKSDDQSACGKLHQMTN